MKTMLSTLILSLIFMSGIAQEPLLQQEKPPKQAVTNYVVLTKKVAQLKPILLAAADLAKEDGKNFGNFEIIVCGKNIGELADLKKIEPYMGEAKKLGVSIVACGFSLNKLKVKSPLPKEMKIVDNGVLYNLELQKKGYLSLEL